MKWLVILFAIITLSAPAIASERCSGIEFQRSAPENEHLRAAALHQLNAADVRVEKTFGLEDWNILYVSTLNTDPVYLFYKVAGPSMVFVTMWSGAARYDEEAEIDSWVRQNAIGIPERLAACFAWYVTQAR